MKILAIHNFHRAGSASGDDQVFRAETRLLEEHGHKVVRYTASNDDFDSAGIVGKISQTLGMLWSRKHYRNVRELIRREHPDVVHVHTFFPLLSPSILYAANREGVPVVATLHDTRFVCPVATSLREGRICNECGDGCYLRMARHACFKCSRAQSLWVAALFKYHRLRHTFYDQIDRYICLNEQQIRLLGAVGFEPRKISKKYNFVEDASSAVGVLPAGLPDRYVVFYGRIGEEKGVRVLMDAWDSLADVPLVVMGGGPLEGEFAEWAAGKPNVHFLGYTPREKCLAVVHGAEFVVFPSIWYEGCSMVEIETESLGKPLVATDLGFSAEAIEDGYNGVKFPLGNTVGFVECVRRLWGDPAACRSMGLQARREYIEKYTPEPNYRRLMEIYDVALGRRS